MPIFNRSASMSKDTTRHFGDGNDAIAWAAQDAGTHYISHYPGSPVNRVVDVLTTEKKEHDYIINHALNEHIAALAVMGASLCGARSLLLMKHVGLNIAADPLNYAGVTKIKGGMVIVVGTDPGARSSTGEEDIHWYAPQFNFPLLEPATVQGVYDTVKNAFEYSEQIQLPILVFVPGRIAYQSSLISRDPSIIPPQDFHFEKDPENLINVGVKAVINHRDHVLRLQQFQNQVATIGKIFFSEKASLGIVTRGASFSICHEVIEALGLTNNVQLLNIAITYPLRIQPFLDFAENKQKIIIIEDQDGFLETMIKREAYGKFNRTIEGKSIFPAWGEITDTQVRDYLKAEFKIKGNDKALSSGKLQYPERPGSFCEGCPHRSTFYGIDHALDRLENMQKTGGVCFTGIIGGDIGCSSLPPHRTDWLLCMNAGIGISQGIAQLAPEQALISTGGEGSFFHGGIISLQSAIENGINLTHLIFDNRSIAMTGHQESPTSSQKTDMRKLLEAIGVNFIFEVNAFQSSKVSEAIQAAHHIQGVKVIWARGDCALQPNAEALRRFKERKLFIINERCNGCTLCYERLQCPAIIKNATNQLYIDLNRCRRCTACLDVCPNNAISVDDPHE